MINVIVELSKYIILTLMIVYTFHCFYTVRQSDEEDRNELLRQQLLLIFFIDFTAFLVLYLKTFNFKIVEFYAEMLLFFAAIQILYRMLYKKASILLLNNMCMLLSVGFIMLCRLDISSAQKQLLIAAGVSAIALVIPVMIRKMRFLRRLTWVYAGIGIFFLLQSLLLQERVMELNFHCWVYSHPKQSRLLLYSLWHLFYPEIPVSRQSFRLQSLQHFTWVFWFSQRTLEVQ